MPPERRRLKDGKLFLLLKDRVLDMQSAAPPAVATAPERCRERASRVSSLPGPPQ